MKSVGSFFAAVFIFPVVYFTVGFALFVFFTLLIQMNVCTSITTCVYTLVDPETYPILRGLFSGIDATDRTFGLLLVLSLTAYSVYGMYKALSFIFARALRKTG